MSGTRNYSRISNYTWGGLKIHIFRLWKTKPTLNASATLGTVVYEHLHGMVPLSFEIMIYSRTKYPRRKMNHVTCGDMVRLSTCG